MKNQLEKIASRRRLLLDKINTQRIEVVEISLQLQKPLAVVNAGMKAVHFIRSHPTLVTSCFAMLLALRRRDFAGLKQHGGHLLRIYPVTARLIRSADRQD